MKIAIPIWNGCVSSVFDFAHRLLLVDIQDGREVNRSEVSLGAKSLPERAGRLRGLGVNVLVCGAISQALANMVMASGIQVLPYVTGRFDDVLQAYLTGQLMQPQFTMSGYWPGARRGFGRWRRGCRWRGGR
jgi:predicted Fe-Mo cluster-binding NifX family protein